jgi:hypothetical protein
VAKVISTVGMTPFEVGIDGTVPGMVRFVRALSKTGAKVSSSPKKSQLGSQMIFIVWLSPFYIALFRTWCEPAYFRLVSTDSVQADGSVKTPKP